MRIKSQRDFVAGLMFTAAGVAFSWGASTYNIGTGARMGAGYFPLMLGIIMALLGLGIMFTSLSIETEDGEKIGAWGWRQTIFIVGANLAFGVLLGGLPDFRVPAMGFVLAIFSAIAIASMAQASPPLGDIWLGGLIGLALGTLLVALVSPFLVSVLGPSASTISGMTDSSPRLLKTWTVAAGIGGRLAGLALLAYPFYRFAPVRPGTRDYAFLTMGLIALSIWSFIELLGLQMQVWPAFISG